MTEPLFTRSADDNDLRQAPEYRSLNPLSLVSMVIGLSGPLALLGPIWWGVPLVGLALSMLGLVQISDRATPQSGRRLALIGLGLSVGFLVLAPVRYFTNRSTLHSRAEVCVREWIQAVAAHRYEFAFGLTRPAATRPPLATPLEILQKSEAFNAGYNRFSVHDIVSTIHKGGERLKISYVEHIGVTASGPYHLLEELVVFSAPPELVREVPYLKIELLRTVDKKTDEEQWQIVNFTKFNNLLEQP